ncbi:HIT family protein [Globicatella sanguinis]
MTDCIFCKIINGEIPSVKVYEDNLVYAFLDISQTTPGHTLLVPKEHVQDIFDYSPILAGDVLARLPKIAKGLDNAFPDMLGLNILNNNREAAYQSVFHSHWHLIPRYGEKDGFSLTFTNHMDDVSKEQLTSLAEQITQGISEVTE